MSNYGIALLIAAYNNQDGLDKAVLSIAGEDKKLADIIIIDDGSSPPVHLDNLQDYSIKLICLSKNQGLQHALNAGMAHIRPSMLNIFLYPLKLNRC